jgi:hypothetical protein
MYRLTGHRCRSENFPRLAIFPARDANSVQIEDQFSHTPLNMLIQILDCLVEVRSEYLQTLLFLRETFRLADFLGMAKDKRIHPAASD